MPTLTGNDVTLMDGVAYSLSRRVEGEHREPYEDASAKWAYPLGGAVAKLHLVLRGLEEELTCTQMDTMEELNGWIMKAVQERGIPVPDELLGYCRDFNGLYHNLPRQPIHRDLHMHNLLFRENQLAAFLDFDLGQINARLFDLCYFGLSILHDCYELPGRFQAWKMILGQLLAGYHAVSPLTGSEKAALPQLCVLIQLLFTAFYASLGDSGQVEANRAFLLWLYGKRDEIASCAP